jgi:hypothetical protein
MRSGISVLGLAIFALAVGACSATATGSPAGGGGPTANAGGGGGGGAVVSDPCSLLTQAEVTAVVGQAVGAGSNADDPKTCHWQYPPDAVPTIQVQITIEPTDVFANVCSSPGSSALGFITTQVSGIGDGACFTEAIGLASGDNLTFQKGSQVFTIAAAFGSAATTADIEAADKALAGDALGHI